MVADADNGGHGIVALAIAKHRIVRAIHIDNDIVVVASGNILHDIPGMTRLVGINAGALSMIVQTEALVGIVHLIDVIVSVGSIYDIPNGGRGGVGIPDIAGGLGSEVFSIVGREDEASILRGKGEGRAFSGERGSRHVRTTTLTIVTGCQHEVQTSHCILKQILLALFGFKGEEPCAAAEHDCKER